MKALILTNGILEVTALWQEEIRQADLILAADGGAGHARSLGLVPDAVVGDGDSLDAATREWLGRQGIALKAYPRDKDETDLELALLYAVEAGAGEIAVLGAWGGRPDQSLANLHLLAHPSLAGRRVRLLGADYELFLLRAGEQAAISGAAGDVVSLLPLSEAAHGIHTTGLRWALDGDDLYFGPARGVSNEMTTNRAHIYLEEGLLAVVHLLGEGR